MANDLERTAQEEGHVYDTGADIFGADGDKVGSLGDEGVVNGYLAVKHGWGKTAYVPLTAIIATKPDGIQLNLAKDEVHDLDADNAPDEPPAGVGAAGKGDTWTPGGVAPATGEHLEPINAKPPLQMKAPEQPAVPVAPLETTAPVEDTTIERPIADQGVYADQVGTEGEVRVPLAEEELVAGKRPTEEGEVRLHKDVVTDEKTVSAPITHEEVYVERRPVAGREEPASEAFQEKEIEVPVRGEELVKGTQARVTDEVVVGKNQVTEEEQVTGPVRKERLTVEGEGLEREGDINVASPDDEPTTTTRP